MKVRLGKHRRDFFGTNQRRNVVQGKDMVQGSGGRGNDSSSPPCQASVAADFLPFASASVDAVSPDAERAFWDERSV